MIHDDVISHSSISTCLLLLLLLMAASCPAGGATRRSVGGDRSSTSATSHQERPPGWCSCSSFCEIQQVQFFVPHRQTAFLISYLFGACFFPLIFFKRNILSFLRGLILKIFCRFVFVFPVCTVLSLHCLQMTFCFPPVRAETYRLVYVCHDAAVLSDSEPLWIQQETLFIWLYLHSGPSLY